MGKQVDKNNFWFIENNPITKAGVYPYLGKQISQDCEPDKIYYVLRPKEELFRKETLDSLRLIPLIDGHTMIGKDFTAPEDKGLDGTLGDNVSHDTDTVYNDLKIISNKMKEEIQNGKKELSLGYFCRYDKQPGTYKGQRYDYVQRDIIANHLALVDKGRMGADVRVYDSKNIPEGEAFAMDSIDIAIDKDEDIEWITVRGTHVPIKKGATEEQKSKTIEQFFKMKRTTNKEDVDVFENEENRKKFEKLNAELHGKKQSFGSKTELKKGDKIRFADTQGVEYKFVGENRGMFEFENIDDDTDRKGFSKKQLEERLKDGSMQISRSNTEPEQSSGEKEQKQPKDFKLGDKFYSKEDNANLEYLGNDKTGRYMFKDEQGNTWKMSEKQLEEDLFTGNLTEKSESEQAGKNKGTQDSMEYKTIQGEGKMADKKEKVAIDEDKRKIIDEIGGILKEAGLDDELIRTVIGKAEKIAYNKSEAGDDGEEVEEEVIEEENEEKDKKPAKDKCGKDEEKEEEKDKEEEEKKKVVKAFAQKEKLGKEVEDALGTFDHSEMTELEIAKYACDKLDLEVEKGQEISAVKGYLKGLAKAPKATFGYKTVAADSGIEKEDPEFEKFSKGE